MGSEQLPDYSATKGAIISYTATVIHLLYGKDNYRVHAALGAIRDGLAPDDDARRDLASNTTVLDGAKLSPQEQWATALGLVTLKPPF